MSLSYLYEKHIEAWIHDCDHKIIVKVNKFYDILSTCAITCNIRTYGKTVIYRIVEPMENFSLKDKYLCYQIGIYSMVDREYYLCNPFYEASKNEKWFKDIMYNHD